MQSDYYDIEEGKSTTLCDTKLKKECCIFFLLSCQVFTGSALAVMLILGFMSTQK